MKRNIPMIILIVFLNHELFLLKNQNRRVSNQITSRQRRFLKKRKIIRTNDDRRLTKGLVSKVDDLLFD